jgi:hypothetical protein
MDMKPKSKPASMHAKKARKKKTSYHQTAHAIEKKLDEIKRETGMPAAVNNNIALFGYRV